MAKKGTNGIDIDAFNGNVFLPDILILQKHANLNFPSDTEARDAGIPIGGLYHTDGAIKVRLA